MWRFAADATDHVLTNLFTADRTFDIVHDRRRIFVHELNAVLAKRQHELIVQLQTESHKIVQRLVLRVADLRMRIRKLRRLLGIEKRSDHS